ncbi:ATP-binding cassette domain-containing protein [Enterobacteriaceae bacterium H20N1]|uniref:ATP-binding cassette domain-containing protein n=1 Tax=Dryocola boscaweniae TaxID=2925397 RepID=A0A9X3ADF4_9ENTR|nr:ATP-binding cassette domain-containing protein [Dryocola boscaweniae]MCT4702843.1 ATP-binding cassette domain-containing protein [Dryocola boscaweniae]MCT4715366.1 ATP-binding cassette domain-containing protein [Dryocola boscaweniae]MCT4720011.1 ATP-binding cassette domain-containing protein [Dryocola boscaweniae]
MITLKQAVPGYRGRAVTSPLSGTFLTGSMTAVIGANGTGKSTLLKTLIQLQPPVSGHISFTEGSAPRAAWLPQLSEMDRQFPASVYDVVCMGSWPGRGLFSGINRQHRLRICEAIERVGLGKLHNQPVETLSGGQFQRMLFARLLVQNAPLVLLDEPFTGVDAQTSRFLMDLICQMHDAGQTVIAVLHDNALVKRHFPQVLLLGPECCHWGKASEILPYYQPTSLNLALSA